MRGQKTNVGTCIQRTAQTTQTNSHREKAVGWSVRWRLERDTATQHTAHNKQHHQNRFKFQPKPSHISIPTLSPPIILFWFYDSILYEWNIHSHIHSTNV